MKQPLTGRLLFSALALLVAATLAVTPANASVINFGSDLLNETNSIDGTNQFITPHSVWNPNSGLANWISFTNTGVGGIVLPNTTSSTPTATYTEFLPIGTNLITALDVWCDDTCRVLLFDASNPTGLLLKNGTFTPDTYCANGSPSCEPSEGWHGLNIPVNPNGPASIQLEHFQLWGSVSGVQYGGAANVVPEPASFVLLGSALLLVGFIGRNKLRRS